MSSLKTLNYSFFISHFSLLIALALASRGDLNARESLEQIPRLKGCQVHTSVMLTEVDRHIFHRLGVDLTSEPVSSIRKW